MSQNGRDGLLEPAVVRRSEQHTDSVNCRCGNQFAARKREVVEWLAESMTMARLS